MLIRLGLQMEHEDDLVCYKIYDSEKLIWESGYVKEFTFDEHDKFQTFCKVWAKHPGSTAKWDRVSVEKQE